MDILCCALALLGGVIGAGFASGREIVRFFAAHGAMGFVAVAFSLAALAALVAVGWTVAAHLVIVHQENHR